MKKNIEAVMRNAAITFKRSAEAGGSAGWLSDNYYILERTAKQAVQDCRRLRNTPKGSDLLPGLFARCKEMCENGNLPSEEEIVDYFGAGSLGGAAVELLPLAVTCALVDEAACAVRADSEKQLSRLANAVVSLRKMGETDFDIISEKLYSAEKILLSDPSGIYPSMDRETKSFYRRSLCETASRSGKSEVKYASEALKKAQKSGEHIGIFIISREKSRRNGILYLIMEIIMPLAVSAAVGIFFGEPSVGILLFFPLWELLRYPIERESLKDAVPERFPRLSADDGRVMNAATLITVSTLLPSADKIPELEKRLEKLYLSNCVGNIRICCLADFKGAAVPAKPEDKITAKAFCEAADRLNRKYGGGFIFAVRPRVYSETQKEFIGRERKRGAITELIRAIKGNSEGFSLLHGDTADLKETKYLIALDADTGLVFDSARELVSIAEHPLNAPVIKNGRVVKGYGILAPRTENRIDDGAGLFSSVLAGDRGITAYDSLSSERYQDLFGEGIFSGKGLINVDAYYELLDSGLPKETILSHDIIESGYLRTGFVPDVQITDAFPQSVGSYFGRLHRWVRGDWQNIKFIFGKNPLNFVSRYKLFDNLRRSLTPAFCLAAIAGSMVIQGYAGIAEAVAAFAALGARNLFSAFGSLINGGFSALSRLFYSKTLPVALRSFAGAYFSVAFSARESHICLNAAFKAIWRLFVSKRKLLEWSTAAQSEQDKNLQSLLVSCLPSVIVSSAIMLFGMPIHRLIGLIILTDIPITLFNSVKRRKNTAGISERNRDTVVSYASAIWGFFDERCGKENNFLPPDNIQLSPVRAVARRTSPTNIGLMLVSFLATRDFGFITTAELYMRLNLSICSVEKLEKYKGNLLNWYSTETLEPLKPRFVSTVDSGNFLCCLTALKEGLREYSHECEALETIIERVERIINETDLSVLYNERRRLFHIGVFPDSGEKSSSFYDLFMSEARMTAYFAVAKRLVPKNHWGAMGRILVGSGRYTGLASWTGTMFEYFMPSLFLPSPAGSLISESLYFCLNCQRKRAGKRPFGISESGFYAFDGNLNYQYKAHGVQKLGLRRNLNADFVISPYSSFLTMTLAPEISIRNLKKLEKKGMTGRYGFYEAADYSRGRGNGDFSIVRSYMAHHVGMSLVAADNLVFGQRMQKRFMRDGSMLGAESLLEEKIPTGSTVFKDIKINEPPHLRERVTGKNLVLEAPSPFYPKSALFTNGRMTTCITDSGTGVTLFDGVDVTVNSTDAVGRPQGIFAVFAGEKAVIPFTCAIDRGTGTRFSAEFRKNKAEHIAECGNVILKMTTSVLKKSNCELSRLTVENSGHKKLIKGKLVVYFDPCIEKREAYSSHPAFSKLFLTDDWDEKNNCYLFSRRGSAGDSVFSAAGFIENAAVSHESDREKVLTTPEGVFSVGKKTKFKGRRGNPDCCCAFSIDIELKPRESVSYTFALTAGETREQALETLQTVRAEKRERKFGVNPLHSDSFENIVGGEMLTGALYPKLSMIRNKVGTKCIFSKRDLWSFGLSGDLPVFLIKINGESDSEFAARYIRIGKILRSCGVSADLVFAFRNDDAYTSPIEQAIKKELIKEECLPMLGIKGGVHLADLSLHNYPEICALESLASYSASAESKPEIPQKNSAKAAGIIVSTAESKGKSNSENVKAYTFTEGKITIEKSNATVDIPWCMVYSNQSFGTIVSDKSLGFTWAINSRENRLTPWYNDTMSDNRGEMLLLKYNGRFYDIACIGRAEFTPYGASWSAETDGVSVSAEIRIPKRGLVKKCRVKFENKSEKNIEFEIFYYILPVLGVSRDSCGSFFAKVNENGVLIENSCSEMRGFLSLNCDSGADFVCFDRQDFLSGNYGNDGYLPSGDCIAAVGRSVCLASGEQNEVSFNLAWGASENAALKMAEVSDYSRMLLNPIKIKSGINDIDLFFNSFLYSQIKQSRFYGRTGFYQCSGAYGFRDQLQDCLAFIDFEPEITLAHICRCAAVQFTEGDVLHWWHVTVNKSQIIRGVRTRCSDDMLWLPYACAVFRRKTGKSDFLKTEIPYIIGDKLADNEKERYFSPSRTNFRESLLKHCIRAVDYSMKFGKNGLPLIGSGDWNDGFGNIGTAESGESVWLGMFMIIVLEMTAEICEEFGMRDKAEEYNVLACSLRETVAEKAWNKDRFERAITSEGCFLAHEKDYIDILPQAFSAFAGVGTNDQINTALSTALKYLFDEENGVVRLLSPPFEQEERDKVGYIASYPPGIRENSGQYTHAAVWLAYALLRQGRNGEALRVLSAISPLSFADEKRASVYRAEPYVLSGDVYFGEGITGRAGWSHFTGSAAWYFRVISENPTLFPKIKKDNSKAEKTNL